MNGFTTVTGKLKGYDQLMNLVLDDVKEVTRGELRAFGWIAIPPPVESLKQENTY